MRSEKGAITLYVSLACLFILIIGISNYILSSNKQAAQIDMIKQIESQYNLDGSIEDISKSYEGGDIIPIYNLDDFKKIGTDEQVSIDGKIYTFSTDATYELKTDLTYDDDYSVMIDRIKNNDIVVTGEGYEVAVPINNGTDYYVSKWNYCVPRGKVYASLYRISNDEYHLIFNASGNIARGYTESQLVGLPEEISNGSGSTSPSSDVYISNKSWGSYSSLIKKAKVEESISPKSTEAYFVGLSAITEVEGLENIDTSNVTDMFRMFNTCTNLVSIDLSTFDTSNVQRMQGMFYNCSHLTNVNLSNFDLSSATNTSYMFSGCSSLTTLDLSSFVPEHTTNMSSMFRYCSNLTTIYVGEDWTTNAVTSSTDMFKSCTNLVGAIPFNANITDKTHANWETGYLTLKVNVSYNANGGTGTMQSTITPTVAANGFTPPNGLSFKEWNTQANGSGTSYAPGDRILSNMRLYAIWGTINEILQEGDWVLYDTGVTSVGTNGVISCRVLYNDQAHGLQIISADIVGNTIQLNPMVNEQNDHDEQFVAALGNYNDAIITLNTAAGLYLNTTYAYDARCVGSYPNTNSNGTFNNKNKEVAGPVTLYDGVTTIDAKNTDTNYETDWTKMGSLGTLNENIQGINKDYWLASHNVDGNSGTTRFCVRHVKSNNSLDSNWDLCHVDNGGRYPGGHPSMGIRPCFTLRIDIQVTGGDGTSEATAYTLGV